MEYGTTIIILAFLPFGKLQLRSQRKSRGYSDNYFVERNESTITIQDIYFFFFPSNFEIKSRMEWNETERNRS